MAAKATKATTARDGDADVRAFFDRFIKAYDGGDPRFFDLFAPDATIFSISSSSRIEGRDEFRKGFGPHLKKRRVTQVLSPKFESYGDSASVSYNARIQVDGRSQEARCSLVLRRDDKGNFAVSQMHVSPLAHVQVVSRTLEDIALLEERVATTLSAVGTPK